VINVALACGFTSPSHFSKCYRAHFNRTPYRERGAPAQTGTEKAAKADIDDAEDDMEPEDTGHRKAASRH
jgi:AraC-like DNA-binding protein